jgi:signal transduction histidine kinase
MKQSAVPLAAAIMAAAAIAGIVGLEWHAESNRDAQIRLSAAATSLNALQMVPFRAATGNGSARRAKALMRALEARILATVAGADEDVAADSQSIVALVQRNFADLERTYAWSVGGQEPAGRTDRLLDSAEGSRLPAAEALKRRGAAYAAAAHTSQVEAAAGSIVVIVVLLGAFLFYYLGSASVRRRERLAYAELDVAQAERKRLLVRAVEAAEDERMRIASDLHDGPIQRLTAAAFTIDLLGRKLARGERELDGLVAQVREQLSGEMDSLRRLMSGLRPQRLDQGDVTAAIRDFAAGLLGQETTYKVRDAISDTFVARDLENVVYHVAREALVNVHKHAHASHVAVTISSRGDSLQLTVIDNGTGFDPETAATARLEHHLGLTAMHERVESVGGEFHVVSEPGAGTRIDAILPLPQPLQTLGAEGKTRAAVA